MTNLSDNHIYPDHTFNISKVNLCGSKGDCRYCPPVETDEAFSGNSNDGDEDYIDYPEITKSTAAEKSLDVLTDRGDQHGDATEQLKKIGQYWGTYLGTDVSGHDVAKMMVLLKVARANGSYTEDNYVDMCGYASIANMVQGNGDHDDK